MDTGYSSTPLGAVNDKWELTAAATADCFYVKNVARKAYLEWYASQSNWSGFGTIGDNEALFAQQIYYYVAEETPDKPVDPEEPATVSIETALKGSTGDSFTVKGVVTLVDGTNISTCRTPRVASACGFPLRTAPSLWAIPSSAPASGPNTTACPS